MQIQKNREYLKYLERKGEGKINWEVWDRLIAEGRKWIEENLKNRKQQPKTNRNNKKKVYTYTQDGELYKEFESQIDCSKYFSVPQPTINVYVNKGGVIKEKLLSSEPLTKDVAFTKYRSAIENNRVYINVPLRCKHVYLYNSNGEMVGVYESKAAYFISRGKNKNNTLKSDTIVDGKLVSFTYYNENEAKLIYHRESNKI